MRSRCFLGVLWRTTSGSKSLCCPDLSGAEMFRLCWRAGLGLRSEWADSALFLLGDHCHEQVSQPLESQPLLPKLAQVQGYVSAVAREVEKNKDLKLVPRQCNFIKLKRVSFILIRLSATFFGIKIFFLLPKSDDECRCSYFKFCLMSLFRRIKYKLATHAYSPSFLFLTYSFVQYRRWESLANLPWILVSSSVKWG